ncbi:MAG: DUF975 family protein [Oscillospiraceae bacterium]
MNSITSIVKNNSKKALSNNFGRALVIIMLYLSVNLFFCLLHLAISLALGLPFFVDIASTPNIFLDNNINITFPSVVCSSAIALITFLVVSPLEYGLSNWFYRLVGGENDEIISVFYFFESTTMMFKSWLAKICVTIRMIFWSFVCFLPSFLIFYYGEKLFESFSAALLIIFSMASLILGTFFFIMLKLRYFLVRFFIISDRKITVRQAIKLSVKASKGQKVKLFKFHLSFIGWLLLSFLLAPILYAAPYYMASKALYARVLIENYNQKVNCEIDNLTSSSPETADSSNDSEDSFVDTEDNFVDAEDTKEMFISHIIEQNEKLTKDETNNFKNQ